jgi:hypothetical protein
VHACAFVPVEDPVIDHAAIVAAAIDWETDPTRHAAAADRALSLLTDGLRARHDSVEP